MACIFDVCRRPCVTYSYEARDAIATYFGGFTMYFLYPGRIIGSNKTIEEEDLVEPLSEKSSLCWYGKQASAKGKL